MACRGGAPAHHRGGAGAPRHARHLLGTDHQLLGRGDAAGTHQEYGKRRSILSKLHARHLLGAGHQLLGRGDAEVAHQQKKYYKNYLENSNIIVSMLLR